MLQSLLGILKNRYFWVGLGFVFLVVLTLVVGAWLGLSMVIRLLIVIGLLVVGMAFILVEFVRASRNAQRIEQSIKMQADEQRKGSRPDKQAEIDELQERLEQAIGKLKTSKLGRGRRGKNALYALPWYMFIGPPGAGKTTAIKNSGLNFPVGTDGVRGVGGTRNCDWFFTDQAILLDTAGRYMTEKQDEQEWHAFLDMLKDHRKDRPINGVIVGISIDELVDAAPDKIEWHANNIRRRIGELVERLEVRFPVYVVFTKCDLLQGFVDFFGDVTQSEREQIWGCTLTEEQREQDNLRAVFEREYDLLYEGLIDARTERLSRSMKREDRRRVYVFPIEFASAKENLSLFIDQLFQENPYQENPEFRGFYFTSGTQEGAPIDRVIRSISEEFDFSGGLEARREPEMETKSYFIKDLFTETIIPDQYLVEQTSSSVRRGRLVRWGVGAASVLLIGLFAVVAGQAVVRSEASLGQVEEVARDAAAVQWDGQSNVENLERLDRLGEEVDQLETYEEDPPFLRWGLYRGGTVLAPARDLFYQKMRPLVRAQFQKIEQQLAQADTIRGSLVQEQRLDLRESLRAYLLLSEEAARLDEEQEQAFLRRYLTRVATESTGRLVTTQFQSRSGQVEAQMHRFVEGMSRQAVAPFEARSALVRDVRRLIYRKPTIQSLYAKIRQEGMNSLEPVRLSRILRESGGGTLFKSKAEVSGFFTKQGWNSYVQDRIEKEAQNPGQGGWVLGKEPDQLSDELQNSEVVTRRLRERYFREYASAWKDFLRSVEYRSFGGVRQTSRVLNKLGDPYNSPLLYLLARVSEETTFAGSMAEKAKGQVQDELETRAQSKARMRTRTDAGGALESSDEEGESVHPVTRQFTGLHRLDAEKAASGDAAPSLTRSLQALGRMGSVLDGLVGTPENAMTVAQKVLDGEGELISALRTIRTDLAQIDADARRHLFDDTILRVWSTVLQATQRHLNDRWRRQVYRPYQETLEGRYPFSKSQQDATLADVERYFHPQRGAIAMFEEQTLRPFLRKGRRTPKRWEGQGIQLSSEFQRLLDAADRIGQGLFSGGSLQLRFEMTPEIPKGTEDAPSPSQVFIRAHGTSQDYQMGYQPTTTFTWPGERGARILLTTRAGELGPKQYNGAWAWFRLLEDADVEPRAPNEYRVRWVFKREGRYSIVTRFDLRSDQNRQLFTNPKGFFRLRVPETID